LFPDLRRSTSDERFARTFRHFRGCKRFFAAVGLLDELEQEAQRRKASVGDVEKRKAEREEIFHTQIEPGLSALYEYLQKLTASLKVLKPKKQQRYMLAGYGEVVGYLDHDYDLKVSSQTGAREIKLAFPCVVASDECPSVEIQGATKIKAVAGAFQRFHFGGLNDPRKDSSGEIVSARFNAKGKITLSATFSGDIESAAVRMTFANFEGLGSVTKTVTGAQLNDELFDDIGRFLTREPNSLLQEVLPDSYRNQLKTKVQQDQIKRRWETKINEQQQTELARIKRDRSITGRFSRLVTKDDKAATANPSGSTWLGRLKGLVKKEV
jgi:hypothetical protein